jgi:hypothetical protein
MIMFFPSFSLCTVWMLILLTFRKYMHTDCTRWRLKWQFDNFSLFAAPISSDGEPFPPPPVGVLDQYLYIHEQLLYIFTPTHTHDACKL